MNSERAPLAVQLDAALRFSAAAQQYLEDSRLGGEGARMAAHVLADVLRSQAGALFHVGPVMPLFAPASLAIPALGVMREHLQRAARWGEAAQRVAEAQARTQLLWFDALRNAANAFVTRVSASDALSIRGLHDTWIDCAEQAYAVIVRSDAFCDALADLINAGSQWRFESVAAMEQGAKTVDMPTRSELNSLMRRLAAVEQQLQLEREQQAVTVSPADKPRAPRKRRTPQS